MSIRVACELCGTRFSVKAEAQGKRIKCRQCGEPVLVPRVDEENEAAILQPRKQRSRQKKAKQSGGSSLWPLAVMFGVFALVVAGACLKFYGHREAPVTSPATPSVDRQTTGTTLPAANGVENPKSVVVPGTYRVDVMGLDTPPRLQELADRFQQSVQKNREWFIESTSNRKPGSPMLYDPRTGLTKVEFDEYTSLLENMSLRKEREAVLKVTASGDDVFTLDGQGTIPELTGIQVDLKQNLVRTSDCDLTEMKTSDISEGAVIGPWKGFTWQHTEVDKASLSGISASLSVGRLKQSGRGLLYYKLTVLKSGTLKKQATVILNYDL